MLKKYKGYTAEQLLADDIFVSSMRYPTTESEEFWAELSAGDPALAEEIAIAAGMLGTLSQRGPRMSAQDKSRLWNDISRQTIHTGRRRRTRLIGAFTAAAAVVAVGLVLLLGRGGEERVDYSSLLEGMEITGDAAGQNVRLMVADGRDIDLEGREALVVYDAEGKVVANNELVADAAPESDRAETRFNRLLVPRGKRSRVVLSDGTVMWVNSGTKVIYPAVFLGAKREVFVEGEIYLEVAKDPARPFVVRTDAMEATVLGTSFNLSAYGGSDESLVLVEGSVKVETAGKRTDVLTPGQILRVGESVSVAEVNVWDHIAWKDGFYIFRNEPLSSILAAIGEYYGVGIEYNSNVDTIRCSGRLLFDENLEAVIATLNDVVPRASIRLGGGGISID